MATVEHYYFTKTGFSPSLILNSRRTNNLDFSFYLSYLSIFCPKNIAYILLYWYSSISSQVLDLRQQTTLPPLFSSSTLSASQSGDIGCSFQCALRGLPCHLERVDQLRTKERCLQQFLHFRNFPGEVPRVHVLRMVDFSKHASTMVPSLSTDLNLILLSILCLHATLLPDPTLRLFSPLLSHLSLSPDP